MERRPSLLPPADAEHYDDLSDLERERHENDMRLKNTFEHIFDKYSRDFDGIGDEIDLETGEIVVDNGHLVHLEDERDTGRDVDVWVSEDDGCDDEEDELLSSPGRYNDRFTESELPLATPTSHHRPHLSTPQSVRPPAQPNRTPQMMDFAADPAFFQALGQSIAQGISQYMSSQQDNARTRDSAWDAPPLPHPPRSTHRPTPQTHRRRDMVPQSPRHPPSRSVWASERPIGRPRLRRYSGDMDARSPSIRYQTEQRQTLAARSPETFNPVTPVDDVQYSEEDDVNAWARGEGLRERDEEMDPEDSEAYHHPLGGGRRHVVQPEAHFEDAESSARRLQAENARKRATRADQQYFAPSSKRCPKAPAWTEEEDELLIELREVRKMPHSQCSRFFPTRPARNVENHYYSHLANRPNKDAPRSELSEFVRQALRKGPIVANKAKKRSSNTDDAELLRKEVLKKEVLVAPDSDEDGIFQSSVLQSSKEHYDTQTASFTLPASVPAPPGTRVQKGTWATWDSKIFVRDQLEPPYLCTRCGKSWAGISTALMHNKHPEQCEPGDWAVNYAPATDRKRKATDGLAKTPRPDTVSEPKRPKLDSGIHEQLTEAAQAAVQDVLMDDSRTNGAPVGDMNTTDAGSKVKRASDSSAKPATTPAKRGFPKRFTISDRAPMERETLRESPIEPPPHGLIDTSKVMEAVQQHMKLPLQMFNDSMEATEKPANTPNKRSTAESSATGAAAGAKKKSHASPNTPREAPGAQKKAAVIVSGGSRPPAATTSPKQVRPSSARPVTPSPSVTVLSRLGSRNAAASRESLKASPVAKATPLKPAASSNDARAGTVQSAKAKVTVAVQGTPLKPLSSANTSTSSKTQSAKAKERAAVQGTPLKSASSANTPTVNTAQSAKTKANSAAKSTPLKAASSANTPTVGTTQSAKAKATATVQGTPLKPAPSANTPTASKTQSAKAKAKAKPATNSTPLKPAPAGDASRVTQSARAAPKAPSLQRPRGAMTPQAKGSGTIGRSSPLSKTTNSKPRAGPSFADLLADDSEDELAF